MKQLSSGIFTISIDTELAWGVFDIDLIKRYKKHFENTREVINKILQLFEKYEISATWAIVGHLFLDKCQKENEFPHKDIIRPHYKRFQGDWFKFDPCSNIKKSPFWYGKDIIEKIKKCKVPQEIGSHSFSHIIFDDEGCSKKAAESDIKKCKELANNFGVELKSFIFPRNCPGHLDVLFKEGFQCFRGNNIWYEKKNIILILKNFFRILNEFLIVSPCCANPIKTKEGLLNIPSSMLYLSCDSVWRFLPIKFRVLRAKKGIDKAIKRRKIFHLWFHPFNLGLETEKLLEGLEEIISYAIEKRGNKELDILTMSQICDLYQN